MMHEKAKKFCQLQQQICVDAYGEWQQEDKARAINENEPCSCIMETMDGYSKFFNHAKQGGQSSKGGDHGNQRGRVKVMIQKVKAKLQAKYQCTNI